jgi:hypothetical protein
VAPARVGRPRARVPGPGNPRPAVTASAGQSKWRPWAAPSGNPGHLGRRGRLTPVSAPSLHSQLKTSNGFLEIVIDSSGLRAGASDQPRRETAADRNRTRLRPPQPSVHARTPADGRRRAARPAPSGQGPLMDPDTGVPASARALPPANRGARTIAALVGRAGLPGVSRLGAPAPPVARVLCITSVGRQIDIFSRCPGRHHRPGGWPAPRFQRSGRRRRHQAPPAPGKPGPQADVRARTVTPQPVRRPSRPV